MDDAPRPASSQGRRRVRHDGGRSKQVLVKLTEDEHATVAAYAAAAGMSPASYLAVRGQQSIASDRSSMSLPQARAWVAELYAIKRIVRGSANNLNQLVKAAHATGEVSEEILHHADRIARMEARVTTLLEAVGPELKPE